MRACTATGSFLLLPSNLALYSRNIFTVTEISYHNRRTIDADIDFLSTEQWKSELEVLLQDLQDDEGHLKRVSDMRNDAGVAWHKEGLLLLLFIYFTNKPAGPRCLPKVDRGAAHQDVGRGNYCN